MELDLSALGFQALFTLVLAAVYFGLYRQQRQRWYLTWAFAWTTYCARLAAISAYLVHRTEIWLFAHQVATAITALLLLLAALQFSRGAHWRRRYLLIGLVGVGWAAFSVLVIHDMAVAGTTNVVLLAGVTLWTGAVFWRAQAIAPSAGARMLAWTYTLWGLHHLDYPIVRPLGAGIVIGVVLDVIFILAVAIGTLVMVLGQERRVLEQRTQQLEQLSRLLLRAQEEERRRIARELHDDAGQALTAAKIALDLAGREDESALVGHALEQVRDLSELLRPRALDDLGLASALRAMAGDFARRTRIEVVLEAADDGPWPPEAALVVYRVVQEALTNVARHSGATRASVRVGRDAACARVVIEDDGHGMDPSMRPHLGLLGMRERVTLAGGELRLEPSGAGGLRVEAELPLKGGA
ncbi:MAG TPA: ATP-binding protein [Candidatus Acidoferrales bacterium]|nr:ATP-binding protein [Candidatus Acidoferrales bacterium]